MRSCGCSSASSRRLDNNQVNRHRSRRGSVILVVFVVVVLLSLGAYAFSEMMVVEAEATNMFGRSVQARTFADSGVEFVASILEEIRGDARQGFYHNPEVFQGILLREADVPAGRGRFSIIAPLESDPMSQSVRFGLVNESAKLNVNTLLTFSGTIAKNMLLALPDMTEEIAAAILDWIDSNHRPRALGAEDDYYRTLTPSYEAKNKPLESLDELLLVRGVTPWLLYGEDANRNGLLDRSENDGDATSPVDNADGTLQLGWSQYLTLFSRETNLAIDGSQRIDLNSDSLDELYDQLEGEFGEEIAQFVVAYRLNGPTADEQDGTRTGRRAGGQDNAQNDGQQDGQSNPNRSQQTAAATNSAGSGQSEKVQRGGLDLSGGAKFPVRSIFDLVGVEVQATVNGSSKTLESPWEADAHAMPGYLPDLEDKLSITSEQFIPGRINVNQARLEVLAGLPEMTPELAADIVSQSSAGQSGGHSSIGWLFMEGLVDIKMLRVLAPYLTVGGDLFRMQVLGYFDVGAPVCRIEAVIDATDISAQIVFMRDLTSLGEGYPRQLFATSLEQP